jgi:hypothetical protein
MFKRKLTTPAAGRLTPAKQVELKEALAEALQLELRRFDVSGGPCDCA